MCGISAIVGVDGPAQLDADRLLQLYQYIDCRGPDHQSEAIQVNTECGLKLHVKASVLHLRGQIMQRQPVVDDNNNVLMFNGQIYEFLRDRAQVDGDEIADTTRLFERLNSCLDSSQVVDTLSAIDGPFAFVYWNEILSTLFYGRDIFGRKSLCMLSSSKSHSPPLIISSVAKPGIVKQNQLGKDNCLEWLEVECNQIYSINFNNPTSPTFENFRWNIDKVYPRTKKCSSNNLQDALTMRQIEVEFLESLNNDLRPAENFGHEQQRSTLEDFERHILKAVETRVKSNLDTCIICRHIRRDNSSFDLLCNHVKIGVAFSGGIDSTLLALALDKTVDPQETIDLVTVAFKNNSPDRASVASAFMELRKLCPARKWQLVLCDISREELAVRRSETIADLIAPCKTVLDDSLGCASWFIGRAKGRTLSSQVGDEWMAHSFEEFLEYNPDDRELSKLLNADRFVTKDYTSPASMFFVGSSIDEQLGGYTSHRVAWRDRGNWGLFDEISFLMRRLSARNLGRDDRVYSHHGRDIKLPYLDFRLVSFLNQLPIGLKMDLNKPSEEGPKWLLRKLASKWGLSETARRVKRALQFGTKIANLDNPHEKGEDICLRLDTLR